MNSPVASAAWVIVSAASSALPGPRRRCSSPRAKSCARALWGAASAALRASGFSTSTCLPAAIAASIIGWCRSTGVAMLTSTPNTSYVGPAVFANDAIYVGARAGIAAPLYASLADLMIVGPNATEDAIASARAFMGYQIGALQA